MQKSQLQISRQKQAGPWQKKLLRLSFNFPQMQTKLFLRDLEVERAEFS